MCLGDWRLGRMVRAVGRTAVTNAGTGLLTIPGNPQRVALSLGGTAAGDNIFLQQIGSDVINQTLVVNGTVPLWHISLLTHGDLPTKALTIFQSGVAGSNVSWIEYYMDENVLAKAQDWLIKEGFG